MNPAITLPVAVASVKGTVLQQNQPYQDYIVKYGQFWFEVADAPGFYVFYSAFRFLAILAFLVISTSITGGTVFRCFARIRQRSGQRALRTG